VFVILRSGPDASILPASMVDWEAEGLLEGLTGEERDARIELLETLQAEGVPLDDMRRARAEGELLFMLAGRKIGVQPTLTWAELVERSGLDERLVLRLVRAQGLPQPEPDEVSYSDVDLSVLCVSKDFLDAGVPEDDLVAVGRVLGRGFSQAAEVMRGTALRMVFQPGLDDRELALRYARTAALLTPMMEPQLGNFLRVHLGRLLQTELIDAQELREGRLPGAREITVAFADLVGFTRLGEEIQPDELGAVAGRLEEMVMDLVEPPVRFVKTIGDAVMVVSHEPEPLLATSLALVDVAEAEGQEFPQLRAGLACGEAVGRAGDWFGRPVNLASRVTNIAYAGSVLATDDVRDAASEGYRWSKAGVRRLKGIDDAVPLWRARRLESGEPVDGA
jgi:adenylate cyclase